MNQQPPSTTADDQPATAPPAVDTTSYLIPLDGPARNDLLDALRVAADRIEDDLDCVACADQSCTNGNHTEWMQRVRAWRVLGTQIARLPGITDDEPMIRFHADACRAWLEAGAAQDAGIDEEFNKFTDDPSGIDAAVQALGHVADTLNREYANLRRATGRPPAGDTADADDSSTYTVVGVWIDDEPVPSG